nr:hypothetical protein [Tanacetum cinerariifolium]
MAKTEQDQTRDCKECSKAGLKDIFYAQVKSVIVDFPNGKRAIGTKWVFRNIKDERGIVFKNKDRLVAQGHTQEEGIDYEEVFDPLARIEAIRLFLAYASFMGFMVFQMDVKSAFLYGTIKEEVYVCQPLGFEDPDYPDKVYKVVKALYGLHQAPRAYLCKAFEKLIIDKFQMSSVGELTFFSGLQVKHKPDEIFISQDKYAVKILRKFGLTDGKSAITPIDTEKPLLKDLDGEDVDVHTYLSMIDSSDPLMADNFLRIVWYSTPHVALMKSWLVQKQTAIGKDESNPFIVDSLLKTIWLIVTAVSSKLLLFGLTNLYYSLNDVRTSWNEFSSSMASAVICLSTAAANVDDVIADDDVADDVPAVDAEPTPPLSPPTTTPPPPQDLPFTSQVEPTPPPTPIAQSSSPPQQQQPSKPTIISMDLLNKLLETCTTLTRRVENLEQDKIAQALEILKLKKRVRKLEKIKKLKGEIIANIDADEDVILKDVVVVAKETKIEKKVLNVVTAATTTITATAPIIDATITVAPSAARRRKGVVIRDPKEIAAPSIIIHTEPKSKDKEKGIMVQKPKPLKKQAQIEHDEAYARELEAELNRNINWDDVIQQVQRKEKEDNDMDCFKDMSYDDICTIFEKYFNSNVAFLKKSKEELEEEQSIALKRKTKSSEEKVVKKQKFDEEVEELKKHPHIVTNDDSDVYTDATPLAFKVPVVDYEIYLENNKPFYKIIRADGSHQLFLSFQSLLRNFDREDLEMLWQIVQERFASSKML